MSHFTLNTQRNSAQRASVPFRLDYQSTPRNLDEARKDGRNRGLCHDLNDSIDHCAGILGRAAYYDGQPEDLNKNPGEVLLLGRRFGRASYDAFVKFDPQQGEGSPVQAAELECKGKAFFKMRAERERLEAEVYDFGNKERYLIVGELGGQASVRNLS